MTYIEKATRRKHEDRLIAIVGGIGFLLLIGSGLLIAWWLG